jgi:hypothetical protein
MLSPYSLLSLDELKDYPGVAGTGKDTALEGILNRVSDEIEQHLGRQIVTRGTGTGLLTEYHTFADPAGLPVYTPDLRTLDWPIIAITTIHEDTATPRTYGAGALLTVDVGYELVKPHGIIRRIQGLGIKLNWATSHRAVKVVYQAGYLTCDAVPARIKGVALRYASVVWAEVKDQGFGVSGRSDALGNFTRFAPAMLTDAMKATLEPERRISFWESGERAA